MHNSNTGTFVVQLQKCTAILQSAGTLGSGLTWASVLYYLVIQQSL
jgi:hypothetical protein